ncbi:MAG: helix-turn-helix transcriptional regulator [Fibrobacteres bacterium]|nr:helix-turn-helix transcriptional regulator [Fibrobacterota bacterium]
MDPMTWGRTLREMRKEKGWTQADLASRTDISQPTIADYERDKKQPTLPRIRAIAKAFGVGVDAFAIAGTSESALEEILARLDKLDASDLDRLAGVVKTRRKGAGKTPP